MRPLLRTIHPFPTCVVVATSYTLLGIALGQVPPAGLAVRSLTVVFLSQVCVGSLNDFLDRNDDAETQPDKPIPSGLVSAHTVLVLAIGSGLLLPLAAAPFGAGAVALAALGTGAGISYDLWLKPTPLSPLPYVVAFLSLGTWIWLIAGRLSPAFTLLYPPGSLLLVSAHLANALPDIESDRRHGQRGLAVLLGAPRAFRLMLRLYTVSWCPCLLLAVVARAPAAMVLTVVSGLLASGAWLLGTTTKLRPTIRDSIFRLMAPAIGLLALGLLLALRALLA